MREPRNSYVPDPIAREQAVIELLEEWPWRLSSTLIGGYALAAYGAARYSDDVDFVIPAESKSEITEWIGERGFRDVRGRATGARDGFAGALRYSKERVTLDLLIGFVRDREARADVSEKWISLRPRRTKLDLLSGSVRTLVRVARPEALWALKLQAGRDQDLSDLFAISKEPVRAEEVRDLFSDLTSEWLTAKLARVKAKLESPKLYEDSRSRLGLKDSESARAAWSSFRNRLCDMIPVP